MRAKKRRAAVRDNFRANILDYLSDKSCADCGEADRIVLEFDHLEPSIKHFSISQAVRLGHPWEVVVMELEKCQVLRSNCHKKRTATQFNWYKK